MNSTPYWNRGDAYIDGVGSTSPKQGNYDRLPSPSRSAQTNDKNLAFPKLMSFTDKEDTIKHKKSIEVAGNTSISKQSDRVNLSEEKLSLLLNKFKK